MKCALIEYNYYHDITFPTFVHTLGELGIFIDIFTSERNLQRNALVYTDTSRVNLNCSDGKLFKLKELIHRYKAYDFIILNSIEPKKYIKRLANFDVPSLAILHESHLYKEDQDYTQYLSRSSRKILVLAKHISDYLSTQVNSDWIVPVYLGEKQFKPSGQNIFCVQGNLEYIRRNYHSLLEAVLELNARGINNFKIRMVGGINSSDGLIFQQKVKEKKLENFFEIVERELAYKDFYEAIGTSDFILPLVDNTSSCYRLYFLSKMTTSMSLAIGLNVLPVVQEELASVYKISSASILYKDGGLAQAMERAISLQKNERDRLKTNMSEIKAAFLLQSVENLKNALADLHCRS